MSLLRITVCFGVLLSIPGTPRGPVSHSASWCSLAVPTGGHASLFGVLPRSGCGARDPRFPSRMLGARHGKAPGVEPGFSCLACKRSGPRGAPSGLYKEFVNSDLLTYLSGTWGFSCLGAQESLLGLLRGPLVALGIKPGLVMCKASSSALVLVLSLTPLSFWVWGATPSGVQGLLLPTGGGGGHHSCWCSGDQAVPRNRTWTSRMLSP